MPIPSTPDVLPSPIGGDVLPIAANTPTGTGDLSYAQGWPVLTGLPLEAGGVAPQREFFNAVNALITKHLFFLQSGGVYPWQAGLNYLTGWSVAVDGVGYAALQPSGPDVPEVGPKSPAENPEYWEKTKASVPIATTEIAGISLRATAEDIAAKTATDKTVSPADLASLTVDKWAGRAIGEPFGIWDHLPGTETPPTDPNGPRFIKLTAGDSYNSGLLSGESVSGTAPDITATAAIALADSPLHGQTIHLINTERRFLRGGESGVIEGDAIRNITGEISGGFKEPSAVTSTGAFKTSSVQSLGNQSVTGGLGAQFVFDASRVVPTADENRPRNISATYYLRIF
ncbi:MAG: hypothetical protein VB101_01085 [Rhodospirillaceae bacterium]|nr:hypothetical protein [Rhodospirillaceae bacterium]